MTRRIPILVVDEQESNLKQVLGSEPYDVVLCRSGRDALTHLLNREYACILCDVQAPELDGIEFLKTIRNDPEIGDVPIIFITAHDSTERLVCEAFELGAYDFLSKPVDNYVLKCKLRIFSRLFQEKMALARQRQLFQTVMDNLDEAVALYSLNGEPTREYQNARWSQTIESSCAKMVAEEVVARAFRGQEQSLESRLGGGKLGCFSARRMREAGGYAERVVAVVRDITAERYEKTHLRQRNEELAQFAHAASHDLKTPLRHIEAYAELLKESLPDHLDSPEIALYLKYILSGTVRMRSLIESLLDYAEAGKSLSNCLPVAISDTVQTVWDTLGAHDATLLLDGELPEVHGEPLRLVQLFQNLLENSLKYNREGVPVQVWVWAESLSDQFVVNLRDNGAGIPKRHQRRVFEMFQRLYTDEQVPGNGIGLSICKQVMHQHKGRIEINSDGKCGTTVKLFFPKLVKLAS